VRREGRRRQVGSTGGEYLHEAAGGSSGCDLASGHPLRRLMRWRERWPFKGAGTCWSARSCLPGSSWPVSSCLADLTCSAWEVILRVSHFPTISDCTVVLPGTRRVG